MRHLFQNHGPLSRHARRILSTLVCAFFFSHHAAADFSSDAPATPFPYELVGIARADGVSYASIIDPQTGYHFLLSTGSRSPLGLVLVSIATDDDPTGPSATIQKDGESVTLGFWENATFAPAPTAVLAASGAPDESPAVLALKYTPKPPSGATLPLVFQEVDPQKMTLTPEQKATLNQLRQDFINDVNGGNSAAAQSTTSTAATSSPTASSTANAGGANPNSTNDAQYQNWLAAQDKSDATFRMLFGVQAFNAYTESASYPTRPN